MLRGIWIALAAATVWASEGEIITLSSSPYAAMTPGETSKGYEGEAQTSFGPHLFRLRINGYSAGERSGSDKWSCEVSYDYRFCPGVSLNSLVGYKQDPEGGYDFQTYTKPGIGVRMLDDADHTLDLQANLLYGRDKPDNLPANDSFSSRFGGIYRHQIGENLKFIQEATYRVNLEETQYNLFSSKSAVETKLGSSLSMGLSYRVDYAGTPPPLPQRTEQTVRASVNIDY